VRRGLPGGANSFEQLQAADDVNFGDRKQWILRRRALGKSGLLTLALAVDLVLWGFDPTLRTGGRAPVALVVATAIAVFGLLYFRSRWPRITFVVAWSYCVLWGALLQPYQPFAALLIGLHHVARHLPLRQALWFLLLALVPPTINTLDAAILRGADATEVVLVGLLWCVIFGTAWSAGRWGQRAAQASRWREEKLAAEAALAVQNERLTLARELHDTVSHSVAAMVFQAAGARRVAEVDKSAAARALEVIEACGVQAMRELRDLLGMLSSAADSATAAQPPAHLSLQSVDSLLDLTRLTGVTVKLHRSGKPGSLSALADHTAYRLVQESLTNAIKHSGPGVQVDVNICWHADHVEIAVVSSSASRAVKRTANSGGYGLAGMRYRVSTVGGKLESGWQSESTFVVKAQIPVDEPGPDGRIMSASDGRSR
jgi:signal transduction histidine kinase